MAGRLGMTGRSVGYGDSAVAKSYIPGRGWIPANRVSRRELTALARGGRADAARKARAAAAAESKAMHDHVSGVREFGQKYGSIPSHHGPVRPTTISHQAMASEMGGLGAFAVKTGGRRAPGYVYARPDASPKTLRHEQAHITPKRSAYRLAQITRDPKKQMREEARADYTAGIRWNRKSSLPDGVLGADEKLGSGYARAARNDRFRHYMANNTMEPESRRAMYSPEAVQSYRDVQRQIRRSGLQRSRQQKLQRAQQVRKVDTTMSQRRADELARRYDTRGPLPKHLDRNQRMAAYEARYIAAGGKKSEKWKRRADRAEVGRNVGLAGATLAGAGLLGRKAPGLRRIPHHRLESAGLASGVFGGASELYGEHARRRRASYQNSPAGVAASALQRMRAYTPGGN